jgi:hypothetical protein
VNLLLFRHAECAWRQIIRPWLEQGRGKLVRSYVVVATRGQAYGLKQRCLTAGVPLLGVEFLTPGLARKKWLPLHLAENPTPVARPSIGRELLLLGLRVLIEGRLKALTPEETDWGFWKSVQSDPERVLDDFDELLKAGFRETDFPLPLLSSLLSELRGWVDQLGYELAPLQSEHAALTPLPKNARRVGGRLLVYGLTAELWGEFSNVAALARRFDELLVALPQPEFRGQKALDENWVEMWQALLGTEAQSIDEDAIESCEAVAALGGFSAGAAGPAPAASTLPCRVIAGRTRRDEMIQVAEEIQSALQRGATHVGVVFPKADAACARLTAHLTARGIQFHSTIELAGTADLETQVQRALVRFHQRGARLEELLELWPLLKMLGRTSLSLGAVRRLCERLFDEKQSHALAAYQEALEASERPEWQAVAEIAKILLPGLPAEVTLAAALERFDQLCAALDLPAPAGFSALRALGTRETRPLPAGAVLSALDSLIPEGVATVQPGQSSFARVTLLTRRRAEGLSFSHLFLVEANAGIWPRRSEASPWLPDEHRAKLERSSRFSLGVFSSEDRLWLEKRSYAALLRDTSAEVVFSGAVFDEAEPEKRLMPNGWVERALWSDPALRTADCEIDEIFAQLAVGFPRPESAPKPGTAAWLSIWRSRRAVDQPFDEYFFCVPPQLVRPDVLPARLIERGAQDPAELWFDAVLATPAIDWRPLVRARRKSLGQWVHRVLSQALQPGEALGVLGPARTPEDVRARLASELLRLRANWPQNRYWDSFFLELSRCCEQLLAAAATLPNGGYVATELPLPRAATVPIGRGERLAVRGRVDLAYFDRQEWDGAAVEIIDFKTGADAALSPDRMAGDGFALQLGVYLAAAESLGVRAGRVWMVKPELNGFSSIDLSQLPHALQSLQRLGQHLRSGLYGALTPDPSEYAPEGRQWPLACVPISQETLESKWTLTFGGLEEVELE